MTTAEQWLLLGSQFTRTTRERDFRAHFGGPSRAFPFLWQLIVEYPGTPRLWGAIELLQLMYFFKNPASNLAVCSSFFGVDQWTFKKNLQISLEIIDQALPEVCQFCNLFFINKAEFNIPSV